MAEHRPDLQNIYSKIHAELSLIVTKNFTVSLLLTTLFYSIFLSCVKNNFTRLS